MAFYHVTKLRYLDQVQRTCANSGVMIEATALKKVKEGNLLLAGFDSLNDFQTTRVGRWHDRPA